MNTETKEYIEPIGFKGSRGEFILLEPTAFGNRRRLNVNNDPGGIFYDTVLVFEDYTDNKNEAKANAILLSNAKELAKAIEDLIMRMDRARNILEDRGNWGILDTSEAKKILQKALNINQ